MANISMLATRKAVRLLTSECGLAYALTEIGRREAQDITPLGAERIISQPVGIDVAERSGSASYPACYVYCDRVTNQLREKFRMFSGRVRVQFDIRVSQERLDRLERDLHLYTDAATQVLDLNRGDWGDGFLHTGGYEVQFKPVQRGGRGFVQTAAISFELEVSR